MSSPQPPLSSPQFTVLSFDLYGTLLDWEAGVYPYLRPLLLSTTLKPDHPYHTAYPPTAPATAHLSTPHPLVAAFSAHEARLQNSNPRIPFPDVLRGAYTAIAHETGAVVNDTDVDRLVQSSKEWPPFPDTVAAMRRLAASGRYKFVALSNNSKAGLAAVLAGPLRDVRFDAAYSAEEIGSYKPDRKNFEYLLKGIKEEFGGEKENLIHVAHGVASDQTIAEELGIRHVWVERKVDNWADVNREDMRLLEVVRDAEHLASTLLGG